jgi:D-sedoheptulose 7-phosphate isomerase
MTFPDAKYPDIAAYWLDYTRHLSAAAGSVRAERLAAAAQVLDKAYRSGASVYVCGNGGSAAISNHLVCDHLKGTQTDTNLQPRVVSLSSTIETITAIANDIGYDDIFVYQLRTLARPGDTLITVSSSGDSENIVRAAQWAKDNGVAVIAMTGFDGGRSAALSDVNLHVTGDNYGVIEDIHQSLMHVLSQYLRQAAMPEDLLRSRKF